MRYAVFTLPALALLAAGVAPSRADELPPDLGTRKAGIDWPDFLGPKRDARSPETGLASDWTGRTPRVVWQCELGQSYSAPSISRGRLFHFDRVEDSHRLTCRNSETGAELWHVDFAADYVDMLGYNNGPRATPVVDGERVVVVTPEGRMHCVRAVDGGRVWTVDAPRQFGVVKNFFGVASTPIVWGDLLIANIGGSPEGSPPDVYAAGGRVRGNGTGVVAFDKRSGVVRWKATDELASYASPVIAEIAGKPWLFVLARGGLLALDPATGKQHFHFPWRAVKLESVNASSPVVVDDEVFISESYGPGSALLRAMSSALPPAKDGYDIVWQDNERSREKAMELHWNTAVHHDGYLYASSGQHANQAELRCVERRTGKILWRQPGLGRSSLLYVDGCLACLSEDGTLKLLRATPDRYEVLADLTPHDAAGEALLDYPAWPAPVLSHGLLYVRGGSRLVCLELIPASDDSK
jgi:outer membrane protein assembly factor BamB